MPLTITIAGNRRQYKSLTENPVMMASVGVKCGRAVFPRGMILGEGVSIIPHEKTMILEQIGNELRVRKPWFDAHS